MSTPLKKLSHHLSRLGHWPGEYWRRSRWHKLLVVLAAVFLLCVGTMYGIARWYIASESSKPLKMGVSFIPAYAESLGLDAKQTMDALINDLGVRRFRLVSYWDQLEPAQGQYDFSLLDWQFQKAEAAGATVSLAIGLRQPRWPECHMPEWAKSLPSGSAEAAWENQLLKYMTAVVNRYKGSPALESYQLENEFLLPGFSSKCTDFNRDRLITEYNLVKQLDPYHKLVISRSNNVFGLPIGDPVPDEYAIAVYKRVWEAVILKRYIQEPYPAWYYAFLAGAQKIMTGKNMFIHELQTEAWPPNHQSITDTSLEEQNKSFDAERMRDTIKFGEATGMREIYLWGAEYWYYRMTVLHDPSLWEVAEETF